jgi:phosphomevalonate kinase
VIRARAPGKVVLWGEYAVLEGAPALVMAVDRYATCRLDADAADYWQFVSLGHEAAPERCTRDRLCAPPPPARDASSALVWQVLQRMDVSTLPDSVRVELDTRGFHYDGHKLGLGSSAALCVAVYAALARLLQQPADLATALAIHAAFQGGEGSGVDVASAWHGGLVRFQRNAAPLPQVTRWALPDDVQIRFVWTSAPARTTDHLRRFRQWQTSADTGPLDALKARSEALFDARDVLTALAEYVSALEALDAAADLGIYGPAHRALTQLAIDCGVVYKPCGAGGGDLGAAFTRDSAAADRFIRLASEQPFLPVSLETAPHGIQVTG